MPNSLSPQARRSCVYEGNPCAAALAVPGFGPYVSPSEPIGTASLLSYVSSPSIPIRGEPVVIYGRKKRAAGAGETWPRAAAIFPSTSSLYILF